MVATAARRHSRLESEMHGSGEVEDCQEHCGQEIGQPVTEALKPRTTLIL
jgi:hypothetical protein